MVEKITFQMSGLVKDSTSLQEIEFWGHDAGEFVTQEMIEMVAALEASNEEGGDQVQTGK
ncbi:hypothetical protein A3K29_02225 [Candidatus Collierbacteria bacterium RIFOXYB2_FULL_46_14]|uniref:Uncharacterized protein n=1 Tax=Candidatus Collierbacteria bacterium GW2011_GWA2_46_26 TaxID=1618381 RepID=A0A0G1PII2_9BACT|nr:MAG: hypothetical protein UW29_C0010G0049 [Candidatus Collierbacteria bacterium GW2011_GWC2_44_13]KKU32532.1 MAG: hypothetical protein UX47_C0010G0048 [Candidatus Collierbacteria bacterium GW2011_GWA2_46_26]OGD72941.1 MAG: hypothetical protein A3K29_02225 [Candidatus Collierbacteria bacterium RIFOXYB2_FULL_46_14]OGD75983.1 MAG: hypothetical protein A3K43_02225 [Candidatus Collierbacteria bacterium RIFOXYA2_FULL_46_20]OGD77319.1 MAG: hypothetical protein A3K39_02225 [Candidatus Collierbacteri